MGHGEIVFPGFLQGKVSIRRRVPPSIHSDNNYCFDFEPDIEVIEFVFRIIFITYFQYIMNAVHVILFVPIFTLLPSSPIDGLPSSDFEA